MKRFLPIVLALGFVLFTSQFTSLFAQGVTTASMTGVVTDETGETLPGATVIATHLPTGTEYGISTRVNGQYDLLNMRVGGPYQIRVTFVGYEIFETEGIYLKLGSAYKMDVTLSEEIITMDDFIVTAEKNQVINNEKTGASTNIDNEKLRTLPTISRSQDDFTRLTPQASGQSFGSRNNLYNNFSLDGSIFNNSFGLDAATPGGQTNTQPVSLDAIEQIEVSLAPYDVRQSGFTGAGVNAVTKSGTNEFKGTVYTYFRNESLIGDKIEGVEVANPDLAFNQYGFNLGGPVIKNKLFFFVNTEFTRREDPGQNFRPAANATEAQQALNGTLQGVSRVLASDLDAIRQRLINVYGYDPGAYEGYNYETSSDKVLAKIDWNINTNNTFSFRYNFLKSFREQGPHPIAIAPSSRVPGVNTLQFENSGYTINNDLNSFVAELNSRFGSNISNQFQVSYSAFRDYRELPDAQRFPMIDITKDGTTYVSVGTEQFSAENLLDQNVLQVTNNLTFFAGKHVLTGGVTFEHFDFKNNFNLQRFGYPFFGGLDIDDFFTVTNPDSAGFVDLNAIAANGATLPVKSTPVRVGQIGFYAQDEFSPINDLTLTFGIRVDMPIYNTTVAGNTQIENKVWVDENGESVRVDLTEFPKSRILWSPRVGFNYNFKGEDKTQIRGGTGIFTGRIPFVWISNQAANSQFDPFYTFQLNGTTDDFKFPQVWRSNLAVDHVLPGGWALTVEGIFTKDLNAVVHRNYNQVVPNGFAAGADGRAIFTGDPRLHNDFTVVQGDGSELPTFLDAGLIMMDNTNEGYQYNLTAQVRKDFDNGLYLTAAYTYSQAKDVTSNPGEIAADAFQRNAVVGNPNLPQLAYSAYGLQHRFIAAAGKQFSYGDGRYRTGISMFFEAGQGNRFSYTYAGDMNRDGISGNDLIYVPADQSEIELVDIVDADNNVILSAAEQWNRLDAYIQQDDYLSGIRGEYAERNGALSPWFTQLDIKFLQDFNFEVGGKTNTLQLSFDILNVGNMLNSDWGVRQIVANDRPVQFVDYNGNTPQFQFNGGNTTFSNIVDVTSRWRGQVGIRYLFNQ